MTETDTMTMRHEDSQFTEGGSGSTVPKAASGWCGQRTGDAAEDREEAIPNWSAVIWCMLTNPLLRLRSAWLRLELAWLRWRLRRRGIDPESLPGIQELRRRQEQAKRERNEAKSQGQ